MYSYTGGRTLYGNFTKNTTANNLTLGDSLINTSLRRIYGLHSFPFLFKTATATTVANQQFYQLPYDFGKLTNITVLVGSTAYSPTMVPDRLFWDDLNIVATGLTSNIPVYFYVFNGQLGLYPTPSSNGNTITFVYKRAIRDLSIADYTTGSVVSIANGGTAMVGTGTTWAVSMAGRFIRVTESDTANKGDGNWYEIASSGSTTTLSLVRTYGGTSISAGTAAYTIGQMPILPEPYQIMPIYEAASNYWRMENQPQIAAVWDSKWQQMETELMAEYGSTSDLVAWNDDRTSLDNLNPNLFVTYP